MAEMIEEFFNIEDYKVVQPYVQISESADQQRFANSAQEQVAMEAMTPAGLAPDDTTGP
jgi:hypothetical protein